MPSQEIPCKDCKKKIREIEANGNNKVTKCEPIPGKDGWCLVEWERVWE